MPRVKTSGLERGPLNFAVALAEGKEPVVFRGACRVPLPYMTHKNLTTGEGYAPYSPGSNWAQGGPIIEREKIDVEFDPNGKDVVRARLWRDGKEFRAYGPTPLVAAMRCYVASRLGEEVEIPEELRS
jgi:hypothetical protein